jgi:hypothetical protein
LVPETQTLKTTTSGSRHDRNLKIRTAGKMTNQCSGIKNIARAASERSCEKALVGRRVWTKRRALDALFARQRAAHLHGARYLRPI